MVTVGILRNLQWRNGYARCSGRQVQGVEPYVFQMRRERSSG